MLQMLYISGAARPMTDTDIEDILHVSRHNNMRAGITGMLLWADDMFIQILEGKADKVRDLAARIQRDPRHRNFMVLLEQETDQAVFSDWSMGFKKLDSDKAADQNLFQISRDALASRMSGHDGGVFLDTVLAFSRDFMSDNATRNGAAMAQAL